MEYGEEAATLEGASEGGQPEGTTPEQAAPSVTRQDYEKLVEAVESLRREFRVTQGAVDSSEARVKKILAERTEKIEDYAKKAGLDKAETDYLKREILREEAQRYISAEPEESSPRTSRKASPPDQKAIEEVNQWIRDRQTDTGIPLFDSDPEFQSVDFSVDNPPEQFKQEFEAALQNKAARLNRNYTPPQGANPMRTPGVVKGGVGGNTLEAITRQVQALQRNYNKTPEEMKEYKRLSGELERLQKQQT